MLKMAGALNTGRRPVKRVLALLMNPGYAKTNFMSTTEAAIQKKVSALPPEKQDDVLRYVQNLAEQPAKTGEPYSALRVAMSLKLEGPRDWSGRFEDYLHESRTKHGGA
jgi:hypothetical protein